jgi:hypothetical protein
MDIVQRVKNIIVTPKTEWAVIDAEPATVESLYKSYIIPLSAIPAVIGFLGSLYFKSFFGALIGSILSYVVGLGLIYVFALIIDGLAPTFGGTKNMMSAFKVAAFSPTPIWVASILIIVPLLGFLVLLAALVYTLYVLYLGLPLLMRAPDDKAVPYTALVVVAGLVVGIVVNFLIAMVAGI